MNDQRAGNKVAQTLLALGEKHGDNAEDIKRGQHVNGAEKVSAHGLKEADRPASLLNDADAHQPFAGRLTMPEGFKQGEVSPMEEKWKSDGNRDAPLL